MTSKKQHGGHGREPNGREPPSTGAGHGMPCPYEKQPTTTIALRDGQKGVD